LQTLRMLAFGLIAAAAPLLARPAPPPPVALSADLYRLLTTRSALERDASLRRKLRSRLGVTGAAWDSDCEQDNRDSGATPGLLRDALADGSWLLRAECATGAYQGSFWAVQVWRSGGRAQAALLAWPIGKAAPDGTGEPFALSEQGVVWGELSLLSQGLVELVNRFRGIGDCGTRARYEVRQGRVRIVGLAAVFSCPDTPAASPVGPSDWPIVKTFDH